MNWRALLAGGVFVALLIAAVLIARSNETREVETSEPMSQETTPPIAASSPPLTRADLIDAAARAADVHARGVSMAAEDRELADRRFTLRLPFGCSGSAADDSDAPMRWSYDPAEETLRVSVAPKVWTDAMPVRAAAMGINYEAAEGFWIDRPWLRSGDCPLPARPAPATASTPNAAEGNQAVAADAPEGAAEIISLPSSVQPAPPRETLALVELFMPGSRRAARRNGKPYTVVAKLAPGEIDLAKGLRVIVSGRLVPFGAAPPIACSGGGMDERPLCLIGAEIDRVAITDASGQRILGEWGL